MLMCLGKRWGGFHGRLQNTPANSIHVIHYFLKECHMCRIESELSFFCHAFYLSRSSEQGKNSYTKQTAQKWSFQAPLRGVFRFILNPVLQGPPSSTLHFPLIRNAPLMPKCKQPTNTSSWCSAVCEAAAARRSPLSRFFLRIMFNVKSKVLLVTETGICSCGHRTGRLQPSVQDGCVIFSTLHNSE